MLDFAECERLVLKARDGRSKPIANNTRLEKRDNDTYALRLHATDIATFHRDGRITANSGGWRTVTTKDRLSNMLGLRVGSDHGVWYVDAEPDANDPEPAHGDRTVPKPFHALDPGPEPVWTAEGCQAGTEQLREWDEEALVSKDEIDGGLVAETDIIRPYEHEGGYFVGYRLRHRREWTHWGRARWQQAEGIERPSLAINEEWRYKQCPHCELFDRQHDAWRSAMHGGGWGRKRTHGYAKMVELLERHGSMEAWQAAYLADFREAREQRKLYREWLERNRVMFEDGIEITADGYAKRPDPRAIAREQRKLAKVDMKKKRINRFVTAAVDALANGMSMPNGGDCWYCAMRTNDGYTLGDSMPTLHSTGQVTNERAVEHLEAHIRERYYVPSMFVNALREQGYKDAGIYMFLEMDPENGRMGGERISRETITRSLRRYLYSRLIPELSGSAPPRPVRTGV